MQEHYIQVNGWRVRYAQSGNKGPAVLLIHGLGSSLESWWHTIEGLGQQFRVYAPDLIYFGKSDKPDRDPAPEDFTDFVLGFMDVLGLERAVLIGHSMGGMIASKLALDHPERFDALVLANAAGYGREVVWWLRLRTVLPININTEGQPPQWMIDFGVGQMLHDPRRMSPKVLAAIIEVAQEPGLLAAYQRVIRLGVNWRGLKPEVLEQVRDQAHRIKMPTLVIWGKQDRIVPVAHVEAIRQQIRHARIEVIDGCGHAPMIEHPELFNALVTDFVREQVPVAKPRYAPRAVPAE